MTHSGGQMLLVSPCWILHDSKPRERLVSPLWQQTEEEKFISAMARALFLRRWCMSIFTLPSLLCSSLDCVPGKDLKLCSPVSVSVTSLYCIHWQTWNVHRADNQEKLRCRQRSSFEMTLASWQGIGTTLCGCEDNVFKLPVEISALWKRLQALGGSIISWQLSRHPQATRGEGEGERGRERERERERERGHLQGCTRRTFVNSTSRPPPQS